MGPPDAEGRDAARLGLVLPALAKTGALGAGAGRADARAARYAASAEFSGIADGFATLEDPETCRAFLHTARSIMDVNGQRVSARERLYLAQDVPTLIVWGDRDPLIPVEHGRAAHELMPDSRLEVFEDAGHFPFRDDPERFVAVLQRFIDDTDPRPPTPDAARDAARRGRSMSVRRRLPPPSRGCAASPTPTRSGPRWPPRSRSSRSPPQPPRGSPPPSTAQGCARCSPAAGSTTAGAGTRAGARCCGGSTTARSSSSSPRATRRSRCSRSAARSASSSSCWSGPERSPASSSASPGSRRRACSWPAATSRSAGSR